MTISYTSIFNYIRPSKIYPNWDSWFENKPSGNPGPGSTGSLAAAFISEFPALMRFIIIESGK
jgi:hypothetical protein